MTRCPSAAALALVAAVLFVALTAIAGCLSRTSEADYVRTGAMPARPVHLAQVAAVSSISAATPLVAVGEVLPRGRHSIILDAQYYGLPPVSDGWVHMRVGRDAYRVDWETHEVLARVTDEAGANF